MTNVTLYTSFERMVYYLAVLFYDPIPRNQYFCFNLILIRLYFEFTNFYYFSVQKYLRIVCNLKVTTFESNH